MKIKDINKHLNRYEELVNNFIECGIKLTKFQKFILKIKCFDNYKQNRLIEHRYDGNIIIYPDTKFTITRSFGRHTGKTWFQTCILQGLLEANLTNKPVVIDCEMKKVKIK